MYKISKHAMERYAERLLRSITNIPGYIADNEDKIVEDINMMIEYGELLGTKKDNKGIVEVYLNHKWVILADSERKNVITIYKINFGLGDDFDYEFISQSKERIRNITTDLQEAVGDVAEQIVVYKDLIKDNENLIKQYRNLVKKLEAQNEEYQSLIELADTQVSIKQQKLNEAIGDLIQRKEF